MHSWLQDSIIDGMNQLASSPGGSVIESNYKIIEDLYWNGNLTCLNFPLKADSMDETQQQIVFTGSLASGSYTYDQGGEMYGVYAVQYGIGAVTTWRRTEHFRLNRDSLTHHFTEYMHNSEYGVIQDYDDIGMPDKEDLFTYRAIIPRTEAKMVMDLTKPLGYATN